MKYIARIENNITFFVKAVLGILLLWGLSMVLFKIKPFWHDEWRLIYNLKFKTHQELWGTLEYTQQFPRVYLQLTKWFTAAFHYNYFSLRVPAFALAVCSVFFCWHLMNRIYKEAMPARYLLVLMTVSNFTFIEYLVQTKQYQMEILMSLVALWQAIQLILLFEKGMQSNFSYGLICLSFLLAPYFSYTYPIAVAPLFGLVFLQLTFWKKYRHASCRNSMLILPLLLSFISITIFYFIDVQQLMNDREMQQFWKFRMATDNTKQFLIIKNLWGWLAKMGSGFVFECVFGTIGWAAVGWAMHQHLSAFRKMKVTASYQLRVYCIGLVIVSLLLFFAGKLPLSEPKFNAFTIPALSILIIYFLTGIPFKKSARVMTIILLLALGGNIITSVINMFTLKEYRQRISILHATDKVIRMAQKEKIPILITPGVAYSDDITIYMPGMRMITADVILKTFPAYHPESNLPVYAIDSIAQARQVLAQLPHLQKAWIGDGWHYHLYSK